MKIVPINDNNSDFNKVVLKGNHRLTPHCKEHGAMLKVSKDGLWRCIRTISLQTGKCVHDCRAGCKELNQEAFGGKE